MKFFDFGHNTDYLMSCPTNVLFAVYQTQREELGLSRIQSSQTYTHHSRIELVKCFVVYAPLIAVLFATQNSIWISIDPLSISHLVT